MIRFALIVALAFGGGLAAGLAVMKHRMDAELAEARLALSAVESAHAALERESGPVFQRAENLERKYAAQLRLLDTLYGELAELRRVADVAVDTGPAVEEADARAALIPEAEAEAGAADPVPAGEEADASAAERRERAADWRRRMGERFRENVLDTLEDEMALAGTPEAQARILALAEYTEAMFALRQAMRDADTPEAQEAVRAAMRENMGAVREIMDEQRSAMLRDVAREFGVPRERQRDFLRTMRETLDTPFFNPQRGFAGGRERGGGGRGGWDRSR